MAQVFDTSRLELAGEPFRAAEAARFLSASSNGALAYFGWSFGAASRLAWFDREGKQLSTAGQPGPYRDLSLAPDDQRVAVAVRADDSAGSSAINTDLWLLDLVRGIPTRFTFDPGLDYRALWAPDGSRIVFSSNRDGPYNLYQKVSSGAGEEEALLKSGESKIACDWSADGRVILYISRDQKTGLDLWVLPLGASSGPERKPSPFQRTQFNEVQGQFSPDGRWVAYSSDESGKYEVYVRPFGAPSGPSGGGKWQVSTRGASHPRWRRDGKELFFLSADGKLMAVPVKAGATFEPGLARELFPTRIRLGGAETVTYRYAVAADGKRFLIAVPEEEAASTPITVVLNWAAGVQE
jgi:Tol biopolymer transport system component